MKNKNKGIDTIYTLILAYLLILTTLIAIEVYTNK